MSDQSTRSLITYKDRYHNSTLDRIDHDEHTKIRGLLLGHRIEKIDYYHMRLDNGTVILIDPNEGCGGCTSGGYSLDDLNECDNVITAVEFSEHATEPDEWGNVGTVYRVFVVAEDKRINLYAVSGDDGNGYYGTGYMLYVRYPKEDNDE